MQESGWTTHPPNKQIIGEKKNLHLKNVYNKMDVMEFNMKNLTKFF